MYTIKGIDAVASVTELRSKPTSVLNEISNGRTVLFHQEDEPVGVMLSLERYQELLEGSDTSLVNPVNVQSIADAAVPTLLTSTGKGRMPWKLSDDDVRHIRAYFAEPAYRSAKFYRSVAVRYGVSSTHIQHIVDGTRRGKVK